MMCNQVTGVAKECWHGWGNERRFLMLYYGLDGMNWFPAGCLAMLPKETQAHNYCTPVIQGEDLLVVSRTSLEGKNQHDNDAVTFHRFRGFRKAALGLCPGV
jgi:hypothetical protein